MAHRIEIVNTSDLTHEAVNLTINGQSEEYLRPGDSFILQEENGVIGKPELIPFYDPIVKKGMPFYGEDGEQRYIVTVCHLKTAKQLYDMFYNGDHNIAEREQILYGGFQVNVGDDAGGRLK